MATHSTRAQRHQESQRQETHASAGSRRCEHQWSSPFSLMRQGIDEMDRWFSRLSGDRSWVSPSSRMQSVTG